MHASPAAGLLSVNLCLNAKRQSHVDKFCQQDTDSIMSLQMEVVTLSATFQTDLIRKRRQAIKPLPMGHGTVHVEPNIM